MASRRRTFAVGLPLHSVVALVAGVTLVVRGGYVGVGIACVGIALALMALDGLFRDLGVEGIPTPDEARAPVSGT